MIRFSPLYSVVASIVALGVPLSVLADNAKQDSVKSVQEIKAQENPSKETQEIQTLVVTGAHIPNAQAADTVILSREKIALQNSGSATDLLRNSPGIDISQPGGPGGITELFIRGAESNFTVVTLNKVRVNDTTNSRGGNFDLSTINPDDIERVEILKGPLSAVYGSDALAGALNIITKKPTADEKITARAEVGSDDYRRTYLSANGGKDALAANIRVARLDSGEPVKGSTALTRSVGSNLLWTLSDTEQADASVYYIERDRTNYPTGSGGSLFAPSSPLEASESKDTQVQVGWNSKANDALTFDVRTSYFKRKETLDTPAIPDGVTTGSPAIISDSQLERKHIAASGLYQLSATTSFAVGGDYQQESGSTDAVLDLGFPLPSGFDLNRHNTGVFLEGNYKNAEGLELFASARSDKPENHSAENSTKASIAYPVFGADSRVGVSWGQAFKLPSFYAVGDKLVGNTHLKSETSETRELFYTQSFLDRLFHVNASAYHTRFDELIDFDFTTFKLINRDAIEVDGTELEVVANPMQGLEMGVHVSHNDYHLQGDPLLGRPTFSGGFYAEWLAQSWSSRVHWNHVGERHGQSIPTGAMTLKAYDRIDLVVVKPLTQKMSATVNVDNLFDANYQEELGFPSPGRAFRIGLSAEF